MIFWLFLLLALYANASLSSSCCLAEEPPPLQKRLAPKLTPLSAAPDWSQLDSYQGTITKALFEQLVNEVYSPDGGLWTYGKLEENSFTLFVEAEKKPSPQETLLSNPQSPVKEERTPLYTLHFATSKGQEKPPPFHVKPELQAGWKLPPVDVTKPLAGAKIMLDPGHIGGAYAAQEERFFQIGVGMPSVVEGDLTYTTCEHLAEELKEAGAEVAWTKRKGEPTTPLRAKDLRDEAIQALADSNSVYPVPPKAADLTLRLERKANELFYRAAEIRARAEIVAKFKPDLTLCIHYNASPWGNERRALLNDIDRLVVFVNGFYIKSELAYEDQKFALMLRLLRRDTPLELNAADRIAAELALSLGLPPETYRNTPFSRQVGANAYVFARNLLANRIFEGPVVYVEGPYMNSKNSYARFVAGDYEGLREFNKKQQPSLVRQVAKSIVRGVIIYFTHPPRTVETNSLPLGPTDWPWAVLTTTPENSPAPLPPMPPVPVPRPLTTSNGLPPALPSAHPPPLPLPLSATNATNGPPLTDGALMRRSGDIAIQNPPASTASPASIIALPLPLPTNWAPFFKLFPQQEPPSPQGTATNGVPARPGMSTRIPSSPPPPFPFLWSTNAPSW